MNKFVLTLLVSFLWSAAYSQQCSNIIVTQEGISTVLNLEQVRVGFPRGTGTRLLNNQSLVSFDIDEAPATVVGISNGILHSFTQEETGDLIIINEWYITRVVAHVGGGTAITLQDIRTTYVVSEDYATVSGSLANCPAGSGTIDFKLGNGSTVSNVFDNDTILILPGYAMDVLLSGTDFTIDFDSAYLKADSIFFDTTGTGLTQTTTQGAIEEIAAGALVFDSNRPVLRTPSVGVVVGASTVANWVEWWYFAPPTMSIVQAPTTTVYEVGNVVNLSWTLTTSNPGSATLSNGEFRLIHPVDSLLSSFGSSTSHGSPTLNFTPQQGAAGRYNEHEYQVRGQQDWVFGVESGTIYSDIDTVYGVYPILYGMSNNDYSSSGNPYGTVSKLVQQEGDKTVSLTGSGYIYYFIPKTWGDFALSQIIDHNGLDVTASFTAFDINVSSIGLTNEWTNVAYRGYKLNNTTTTAGYDYQFIR